MWVGHHRSYYRSPPVWYIIVQAMNLKNDDGDDEDYSFGSRRYSRVQLSLWWLSTKTLHYGTTTEPFNQPLLLLHPFTSLFPFFMVHNIFIDRSFVAHYLAYCTGAFIVFCSFSISAFYYNITVILLMVI